MFAARWLNGAFAAWDVATNQRLSLSPPPPARVTGLASADNALVVAGADGTFWAYRPRSMGELGGERLRRSSALVKDVLDVTAFAGREQSPQELGMVGLLAVDAAEGIAGGVPAVNVACDGAACRYAVGEGLLVTASEQPGVRNVWDGLRTEPAESAGEFFVCRLENRVVEMSACAEWTGESLLFARALAGPPALPSL